MVFLISVPTQRTCIYSIFKNNLKVNFCCHISERERERISGIFVSGESAMAAYHGQKSLVRMHSGVEIPFEKKQSKDQNQEPNNEKMRGRSCQFIN